MYNMFGLAFRDCFRDLEVCGSLAVGDCDENGEVEDRLVLIGEDI